VSSSEDVTEERGEVVGGGGEATKTDESEDPSGERERWIEGRGAARLCAAGTRSAVSVTARRTGTTSMRPPEGILGIDRSAAGVASRRKNAAVEGIEDGVGWVGGGLVSSWSVSS
jgi:hypothetical protein